ncbi:MAG TPA: hypothetical protein VE732_06630 [Nitrososphaera sp.]|nr:hypothetical protein [Nitrososphaera sp.]
MSSSRRRRVTQSPYGKFLLFVIDPKDFGSPTSFAFTYFPTEIEINGRANWNAQNTIWGVKPLLYANREPKRITVNDLLLYKNENSVRDDIDALLSLQDERSWVNKKGVPGGAPPPILGVVWGEYQQRVVLEDITIRETKFDVIGEVICAYVDLVFVEVQGKDKRSAPRLKGATNIGRHV